MLFVLLRCFCRTWPCRLFSWFPWVWCCIALWSCLWCFVPFVVFFGCLLCRAVVCRAGMPVSCRPVRCSAALLVLVGAWRCCLLLGVCWFVWLPRVVFLWCILALESLSGRLCGRPVVWCFGVVCCGTVLPGVVCCGAVLPCGVAVSSSAVLFTLSLLFGFAHHLKNLCKKENQNNNFLFLKRILDTTQHTLAGRQQDHYQISVLHVTR